jgi:hypothetical protein
MDTLDARARRVVEMVQATMSLEGQGITDPEEIEKMVEATKIELERCEQWFMDAESPTPTSPAEEASE